MKKITLIILAVLALGIAAITFYYINTIQPRKEVAVNQDIQIFIPTGTPLDGLWTILEKNFPDNDQLKKVGQQMKLTKVYPGRYTFKDGTTNEDIIERLQLGQQDEIEIMVGNYYSVFELAEKLEPFFETNKTDIIKEVMSRPEMVGKDTLLATYFLSPNTYRFHWNNTPKQIIDKIAEPLSKFWNDERHAQLAKSGYSKLQVLTLASIVQLESYRAEEQPKVAGVYLNRLKKGMKLQADPTVLFAKKQKEGWDLKVKRIYNKDLALPSPYNTYKYAGLPPGPICMPNPSAIDAVLNPVNHDYIFFVADTTQNGLHIFASDYIEHEKNAQIYRDWANRNNIK